MGIVLEKSRKIFHAREKTARGTQIERSPRAKLKNPIQRAYRQSL
jgi:hypothetical protein